MRNSRPALLIALAIDNFGSGLFLPLALVYAVQVVGLSVTQAGTTVMIGTLAGLAVLPLAGRLVDRTGPRTVVVSSQVVQAAGAFAYLVADGPAATLLAALLLAAGQQLFYGSVFALIADVTGTGPKDKAFAVAGMVRTASFGIGSLAAGVLIASTGPAGYQIAIAVDAVSFLLCAVLLRLFVHPVRPTVRHAQESTAGTPLRDRPYLALIGVTFLVGLAVDFFLIGLPVYLIEQLHTPPWLTGVVLAVFNAIGSTCGTLAVHATRNIKRTTAISLSAGLFALWCVACGAAVVVPESWRIPYLLATTLVVTAAGLIFNSRVNALAEAAAPPATRGRYLAAFQYAFAIAGVAAPGVVALFSVATWLPWLVVFACALLSAAGMTAIGPHLPKHAVIATPAQV
ncbi:MFS transporter [Kibdelosporangium persicum]|uniref:Multidrug resistance protein MdtH n=1 Tax=Kibdelosporangium persicum TaxID=2698649 RepID=A0ABX2F308_9PSEU|nr:MFS transporter [Kibdelosporangium persicum]NRN65312.1 Multidrug resistance protein MdtH [Kibdelosporangium persicum]